MGFTKSSISAAGRAFSSSDSDYQPSQFSRPASQGGQTRTSKIPPAYHLPPQPRTVRAGRAASACPIPRRDGHGNVSNLHATRKQRQQAPAQKNIPPKPGNADRPSTKERVDKCLKSIA